MRYLLTVMLMLSVWQGYGQTYSQTYSGRSYPQPAYATPRNYPLSAYGQDDPESLCLTCNHCQITSAAFNPNFPLVLMGFKAERQTTRAVQLRWNWLSDQPPATVELMFLASDSTDFEVIQTWREGFPNEYIHQNAFSQRTWYQLRINEVDGSSQLSKVREVIGTSGLAGVELFPNPAHGQAYLKLFGSQETSFLLRILDVSGKALLQNRVAFNSGEVLVIPGLEKLVSGMYLIELRGTEGMFRKKLIWRN